MKLQFKESNAGVYNEIETPEFHLIANIDIEVEGISFDGKILTITTNTECEIRRSGVDCTPELLIIGGKTE